MPLDEDIKSGHGEGEAGVEVLPDSVHDFLERLLLDSRVVDVPMAYNPTCVIFSSLKPLFFNNLKNESCFSDHVGA
jgi:hypothetical protein